MFGRDKDKVDVIETLPMVPLRDVVVFPHMMIPFVIGRPSRIRLLDRLIQFMKGFDGVWFATLEQIANHALSTGRVRYRPPADMTIVSRP